ncbi:molybdopterin-guanine dinucleotide biosynthesis protein MobB [Thermanaerovibrio acidaminovorans]|uniref:molybdopterin-guanine dinucleotide biosynthesis protein MobB n=1 Tax=Thermanaerovibrio acidaminovorans TaxID=81462 RepID=UPI0002F33097|nr:molybdopterin-guanine dinucleotide biosynthesis protein MobB [Thermanaerovibrio acidaminovorans]
MLPIVCVCGLKDSGKTTLCSELLVRLSQRGCHVGFIKRTHEEVLSPVSTDTGKALPISGSAALLGPDGVRFEMAGEWEVDQVARRLFPTKDLVIVEGGKSLPFPKVWVGKEVPQGVQGVFFRYDPGDQAQLDELCERLLELARSNHRHAKVMTPGGEVPMKGFVADFLRGSLLGMLRELKGVRFKRGWIGAYVWYDGEEE